MSVNIDSPVPAEWHVISRATLTALCETGTHKEDTTMSTVRGDQYTGKLFVGQAVNCGLYYAGAGYITKIDGEQAPQSIRRLSGLGITTGGNANITVRFASGYDTVVPEGIVRGVQWHISDEHADTARIDRECAQAQAEKAAAAQAQAEADAKARVELPKRYPYLETAEQYTARTGKAPSSQELAASNIRRDLKRAFPGVKFSVRAPRGEIRVAWTDGPTSEQVEKITGKYDAGEMDWTGDYTDYKPSTFNDLFGGVRFLFVNRDMSKATEQALDAWAEGLRGSCWWDEGDPYGKPTLIWQLVSEYAIPVGKRVIGAERLYDAMSGSKIGDFYRLTFA